MQSNYRIIMRTLTAASAALILTTGSALAESPASGVQPKVTPMPNQPIQSMPSQPNDSTLVPPRAEVQPPKDAGAPASASKQSTIIPDRDNSAILAKELIGNDAVTKDGVKVGTVQDLILDQSGRVTGIVVSTGGFLGVGGKAVGISTQAVDMRTAREQEAVFVNMSANEIKTAPPLWKKNKENPVTNRTQ